MGELLEDLIRCYAPQAITLQLSPTPEENSVPVEGDREELLRLFTNLLLNAIRHRSAANLMTSSWCAAQPAAMSTPLPSDPAAATSGYVP
jgi:signal transduction histidine kinase